MQNTSRAPPAPSISWPLQSNLPSQPLWRSYQQIQHVRSVSGQQPSTHCICTTSATPLRQSANTEPQAQDEASKHRIGQSISGINISAKTPPLQLGQELVLRCERLGIDGKGVCLAPPTGFVVLCLRALPGERLKLRITAVKKGYAEGVKLQTLEPPAHAVPAPCPYYGPCGGCTLQGLAYEAQLQEKQNQVVQTLRRVGKLMLPEGILQPAVGCSSTLGYRNKMIFHFSSKCWQGQAERPVEARDALGLLRPGSAEEVLPVSEMGCLLQDATANAILQRVAALCAELQLKPHNHPSGQGIMRQLIIRKGTKQATVAASKAPATLTAISPAAVAVNSSAHSAAEYMVVLVTSQPAAQQLGPLVSALAADFPSVVSIALNVHSPASHVARVPSTPSSTSTKARSSKGSHSMDNNMTKGASMAKDRGGAWGSASAKPAKLKNMIVQKQPVLTAGPASAITSTEAQDNTHADEMLGVSSRGIAGSSSSSMVEVLHGQGHIHESLLGVQFRVSPGSFFQTNTHQTEVLFSLVRQAAGLRPGKQDVVLDLYCGTGSIGLCLAHAAKHVYGYEVVGSAVEDAHLNAQLNGISNATFMLGDLQDLKLLKQSNATGSAPASAPDAATATSAAAATATATVSSPAASASAKLRMLQPDVVVVDPARAGLSQAVVSFLQGCGARRVVYVSCNPATQARDLAALCGGVQPSFRLASVTPVDMFPHTDHVETVVCMDRL